jgi:transposase
LYAEIKCLKPLRPASETQQELTALVGRLRQLVALRARQLNQRRPVTNAKARASSPGSRPDTRASGVGAKR